MTAKECFQRMDELNILIRTRLRQTESLRASLSITAPPTDAECVSHTRNVHLMQDLVSALIDAEREMDSLVDELIGWKNVMIGIINQLSDPIDILFLTERYIEGRNTKAIAKTNNYTRRRVQQIIRNGIEHAEAFFSRP